MELISEYIGEAKNAKISDILTSVEKSRKTILRIAYDRSGKKAWINEYKDRDDIYGKQITPKLKLKDLYNFLTRAYFYYPKWE